MRDYDPVVETGTVDVRDRRNPERLLGRLVRRPALDLMRGYITLMTRPPMRIWDYDPSKLSEPVAMDTYQVHFEVSWRIVEDGYVRRAEFLTDTPLGVLQWLPDFRLPGENEMQAEMRRHYADYPR